jgi:NADH-quinone oxidoreductase subunit I
MQALTNRGMTVERKPMSWWERLYLPGIFKGMSITFGHMFKKRPTVNYPEKERPFSPVFRGLQVLNRDEEGRERCTACGLAQLPVLQNHHDGSR